MYSFINVFIIVFVCLCLNEQLHSIAPKTLQKQNSSKKKSGFALFGKNKKPEAKTEYSTITLKTESGYTFEALDKNYVLTPEHIEEIPINFDAREVWKNCPIIGESIDQGHCKNSWAAATCGAFADRLCIASRGKFKQHLSIQELTFCCDNCSVSKDDLGNKIRAWIYFRDVGAVTGGKYNTIVGCQPYKLKPCISKEGNNLCDRQENEVKYFCEKICTGDSKLDINKDRRRVKNAYILNGIENIQKDIMTFGPVTSSFEQYDDFFSHEKGTIYKKPQNPTGFSEDRTIKIIGWGVDNGNEYWLCVHTYGNFWGNNGTFKIAKGNNECKIEVRVAAGEPLILKKGLFKNLV